MPLVTLEFLNGCDAETFADVLAGVYEHSRWIPQRCAALRPFANLTALKLGLQTTVRQADRDAQLALIRAHPELAGKAALAGKLTVESSDEQASAGLTHCSADEFSTLTQYNATYNARFGFPFILAVKGPDGRGLTRQAIIATVARRLQNQADDEVHENLRQIGRIAELRLNELLGAKLPLGDAVMAWSDLLGGLSDDVDGLTCAYLTDAHCKTASQLGQWMREAGMTVTIDAVGNVIGRYPSDRPGAKTLITGSHYDTVRNGGKYDGRAGILLPIAVVRYLHERGEKLPFHLEVVGFSEEEGVRFKSTFLGSNAIIGRFDPALLERQDSNGISMRMAMQQAGHDPSQIGEIARNPKDLLGFVEVHIEQGPILLDHDLPAGIVTSIAGSCRYLVELTGVASHAGTTPMSMRRDAAAAAAEIVLYVEQRCAEAPALVGTVGQLHVPDGSVNVIAGRCRLSLDIRAADDAIRDAAVTDIVARITTISQRRRIGLQLDLVMRAAAVPCAPWLAQQLAAATERAGIPPFLLSSGAGHDAMSMAHITPVAMLFTRCGNGGISHNPLETMTADDAQISGQILLDFLRHFTQE